MTENKILFNTVKVGDKFKVRHLNHEHDVTVRYQKVSIGRAMCLGFDGFLKGIKVGKQYRFDEFNVVQEN